MSPRRRFQTIVYLLIISTIAFVTGDLYGAIGSRAPVESGNGLECHSIPHVSRADLPYVLGEILHKKGDFYINDTTTTRTSIAVNKLREELHLRHEEIPSINEKRSDLESIMKCFNDKELYPDEEESIENATSLRGVVGNDETPRDLVDVVIPITSRSDANMTFLGPWREVLEDLHLIFVVAEALGDCEVNPPDWADFILYRRKDVEAYLAENAWIINRNGPGIRAFGYLVSDRRFVFTIDSTTSPLRDASGRVAFNPVIEHVRNLATPSTPLYFNTGYDPFRSSNNGGSGDFTRGYPYSLRGGAQTGLSNGLSIGDNDFDAATNIVKGRRKRRALDSIGSVVVTIPYGSLYSISPRNFAFSREAAGIAMLPGLVESDGDPMAALSDLLCGWVSKAVFDYIGIGTKSGFPYVEHHRNSPSSSIGVMAGLGEENFQRLADEFQSYFWQEDVLQFMSTVKLTAKKDDIAAVYREIGTKMATELSHLSPTYFRRMENAMHTWVREWQARNTFLSIRVPVSSASSIRPGPNATCAVLTISHNENLMLQVWARYYSRHVSTRDLFVLDHNSDDGSTSPDRLPPGVRVWPLHGDTAGFPLGFMNRKAEELEYRLLRAGYKCVMFTDTDEIIAPHPRTYPEGLRSYFEEFISDPSVKHRRTDGKELAHLSFGNGKYPFENFLKLGKPITKEALQKIWDQYGYIEPPMEWNRSLLTQRKYWMPMGKYSKPLLTKIPIRYRPGFHNNYIGPIVLGDGELFLIHLRSSDLDFCMGHEKAKYELALHMHESERRAGFNDHIVKYEQMLKRGHVCQYSTSCYIGEWKGNQTVVYDTTGRITLERMDNEWESVLL